PSSAAIPGETFPAPFRIAPEPGAKSPQGTVSAQPRELPPFSAAIPGEAFRAPCRTAPRRGAKSPQGTVSAQPRELPPASAAISGEAFPVPSRKGESQKGTDPPPGAAKPGSSRTAPPLGRAPQDPEQRKIYELLDEKFPKSFNEILEQSGYNIVKLQYILLEMELSGRIYQSAQNTYLRKF
ncbi:MAG TPA: hypothetical protein H9849_07000, partial [Candidatus Anaerobutyricum stercoripullorum]|nr:hypothetical protein [Candidatus Anaerobutyricum stercoripullorum]